MKRLIVAISMCFIASAAMAGVKTKCGIFVLEPHSDGWMYINGVRADTQKITFLKEKDDYRNLQMQWMVPRSDYPGWYGMDYIKRNGKAILNVEAIRSNMDQPRVIGSFDCVKVK